MHRAFDAVWISKMLDLAMNDQIGELSLDVAMGRR